MRPAQVGQLSGSPARSLEMSCNACAGLYVAGRGFRIEPPGVPTVRPSRGERVRAVRAIRGTRRAHRPRYRAIRLVSFALSLVVLSSRCVPLAAIPPLPLSTPHSVEASDSGAVLARQLAPLLYLHRDERFRLERVVAVLHPTRPLIAYHLLWSDDAHGAWAPFTRATDQEILWVGYDSTKSPVDLWTYWHGSILHADWSGRGQVAADVQWGKHGMLPRQTRESDLPRGQGLTTFYLLTWLVPELWLGRLVREGPWCFCSGPARYREFTRPLLLGERLDAIVRTEKPDKALSAVFGADYSRKPEWPGQRATREARRGTRGDSDDRSETEG